MNKKRNMTDADLRAILRAGDPASMGTDLGNPEAQAMRRAIRETLVNSRHPRFVWAAAVATAAVSLGILGFFLLEHRPATPRPQTTAPPASAEQQAGKTPPVSLPVERPSAGHPVPLVAAGNKLGPHQIAAKKPLSVSPPIAKARKAPEFRQIFLTAPGGTQIVWLVETSQAL